MTSYLRSLFGSSGNRKAQNKPQNQSTSASAIPAQTLNHVYAEPGTVPPIAIPALNTRERSSSNVAAHAITPSPLRYATRDASSVRDKNRPNSSQQHQQPSNFGSYSKHRRGSSDSYAPYCQPSPYQPSTPYTRPLVQRSASHKGPERPPLHPLYTPNASFSSVQSTSSSASRAQSASSQRPVLPPRSNSATSVAGSESREPKSALKRDSTWGGNGNKRAHVSFINPNKPATLNLHPLLAYSRLHRPPICFDVTFAPSSRTVLDRSTLNPVPPHTLTQPATEPPTFTRLVLRCEKLPWPVLVTSPTENASSGGSSKFYVGGSSSSVNSHSRKNSAVAITNLDILFALHNALSHRVTLTEWDALGAGGRAQRKATRAYEKRCHKMGGGWEGGVRRLDFLGEKMILVGIELDKMSNGLSGGTGKLIFGKP